MPKVLRIINRLNLGGPTYNAAYLSKFIGDEFETLLVAGEKDETEGSSMHIVKELSLVPVIIPEMKRELNPIYDMIALVKLIRIIIQFKPDIVHTHAAKAGTLGRLAAWLCGVKQIYHTFHGHVFHSYFSKSKTKFYIFIERYLARISTKIIAISSIQKKELSEEYNICQKNKIEIVPLGFDLRRFLENRNEKRKDFRKTYSIQDNEIAIGIVGRLVPIKNHLFFIDLIKAIETKNERLYRYFIIGDGELRDSLMEYCKKETVDFSYKKSNGEKLCFTSWISKMDWAYAGLDIVCLTSKNEGTPVSLIEAQAAGKMIVSTDVGGVKDINYSKETFKALKGFDKEKFVSSIMEISKNKNFNKPNTNDSVEDVIKQFSYERLCSDIRKIYTLHG